MAGETEPQKGEGRSIAQQMAKRARGRLTREQKLETHLLRKSFKYHKLSFKDKKGSGKERLLNLEDDTSCSQGQDPSVTASVSNGGEALLPPPMTLSSFTSPFSSIPAPDIPPSGFRRRSSGLQAEEGKVMEEWRNDVSAAHAPSNQVDIFGRDAQGGEEALTRGQADAADASPGAAEEGRDGGSLCLSEEECEDGELAKRLSSMSITWLNQTSLTAIQAASLSPDPSIRTAAISPSQTLRFGSLTFPELLDADLKAASSWLPNLSSLASLPSLAQLAQEALADPPTVTQPFQLHTASALPPITPLEIPAPSAPLPCPVSSAAVPASLDQQRQASFSLDLPSACNLEIPPAGPSWLPASLQLPVTRPPPPARNTGWAAPPAPLRAPQVRVIGRSPESSPPGRQPTPLHSSGGQQGTMLRSGTGELPSNIITPASMPLRAGSQLGGPNGVPPGTGGGTAPLSDNSAWYITPQGQLTQVLPAPGVSWGAPAAPTPGVVYSALGRRRGRPRKNPLGGVVAPAPAPPAPEQEPAASAVGPFCVQVTSGYAVNRGAPPRSISMPQGHVPQRNTASFRSSFRSSSLPNVPAEELMEMLAGMGGAQALFGTADSPFPALAYWEEALGSGAPAANPPPVFSGQGAFAKLSPSRPRRN